MSLYNEFLNILEANQRDISDCDIRYKVLCAAQRPAAFSFTKKILLNEYPRNINELFGNAIASDAPGNQLSNAENLFVLGSLSKDNPNLNTGWKKLIGTYLSSEQRELFFMEQGFIASVENWAPQFRTKPESACLGYVFDDIAQYYMANFPNRLNIKLNSSEELSTPQKELANRLIQRIVARKISKYNNQPLLTTIIPKSSRKKVLVCDQSYADASTTFGLIDDSGFENMLDAAIKENPDADILVKTHPDTSWNSGRRTGYFNHLKSNGNVHILREPINPFLLFDEVEKVYVGTSQMGLEALLAGKEVICFGAPFYAGWGFTDDRRAIPHRHRSRSLTSVFYYFYIWYTIYHVPGSPAPSTLENALDYIEKHRTNYVPIANTEASSATPRVSVIIPVFGVSRYVEAAIVSAQKQSLTNIEIIPVDDCSTDGSSDIIRKLAKSDPRIRPIFLEQNVGQGFARNSGLDQAKGDYIWFLDGDDYFASLNHLESAVNTADKHSCDMVRCRKRIERIEDHDGNFIENREDFAEQYFIDEVHGVSYRSYPTLLHNRHFCNFLYRRSFLSDNLITFKTPQWEERSFLLSALVQAKIISCINSDAFIYRIRTNSTARREKGLHDVEHMLRNFNEAVNILVTAGANNVESPLYQHFCFNVTQFIHYFFRGFFYDVIQKSCDMGASHSFYRKLSELLISSGFDQSCLSSEPAIIDKVWLNTGRYSLLVAALRANQYKLVERAVEGNPISQKEIFEHFLSDPTSELSIALNQYARNSQVLDAVPQARLADSKKVQVVLHIGSSKAGSTYLQHWLNENRPTLLSQGIYYPEVGLYWQEDRPNKTAGHAAFISAATSNDKRLLDHLKAGVELGKGKIHTIILSSEAFFLNENSINLTNYFSEFDVHMVVYLRRQDEWAASQYYEFVGGGAVGRTSASFSEWIDQPNTKRWMSYRTLLEKWESAIGRKRITVRPFEKPQLIGGSVELDFAHVAGIRNPQDFPIVHSSKMNTSTLNGAYLEVLRLYNKLPFSSMASYFTFIEDVHQVYSSHHYAESRSGFSLPGVTPESIMARHHADNLDIARHFLDKPGGQLFESTDVFPPLMNENEKVTDVELNLIESCYQRAMPQRSNANDTKQNSESLGDEPTDYNYGLFEWRRKLFVPVLLPFVRHFTSPSELRDFKRDPAGFVRLHNTNRNRLVRQLCFPD